MSTNKQQPDTDLVTGLQNPATRRQAFGDMIKQYTEPLYWQIRRLVQSHEDANDLLQNTFLKAWQSIDLFRGDASLSTWLHKIAINESLTFLDKNRRHNKLSIDDEEARLIDSIEADTNVDGNELSKELRKAVAMLPEKQRIVFNMRYYDEMPYEEMSTILGTSVGGLKANYHQAVKKIEKYFQDLG